MGEFDATIAGTGSTPFAKHLPGRTRIDLYIEASLAAMADAGVTKDDIDGILLYGGGGPDDHGRTEMELSEHLGIFAKSLAASTDAGGSTVGLQLEHAGYALATGRATMVLVLAAQQESAWTTRTERGSGFIEQLGSGGNMAASGHFPNVERPYGSHLVSKYGMMAQRHMAMHGTKPEHLAAIAHAIRYNASLNPDAIYRDGPSIDDILASPMVSTPLTKLMCCVINDGGVAFIVTTAERAASLTDRPVHVRGVSWRGAGYYQGFLATGGAKDGFDLVHTVGRLAADEAFARSGLDRADVDVVMSGDSFALTPLLVLEHAGFCGRGEAGDFIGDGSRLKVGGELPLNTHGGALACSHAGLGHVGLVEAVRQLRGECGDRQVNDAKVAYCHSSGGAMATHSSVVLSTEAA